MYYPNLYDKEKLATFVFFQLMNQNKYERTENKSIKYKIGPMKQIQLKVINDTPNPKNNLKKSSFHMLT